MNRIIKPLLDILDHVKETDSDYVYNGAIVPKADMIEYIKLCIEDAQKIERSVPRAVCEPVKDIIEGDETNFIRCPESEAQYFGVYINHWPGYSLHVKDYKTKTEAEEIVAALNFALQP